MTQWYLYMSLTLFNNFHLVNHPLVHNILAHLRDQNTGNKEFRELIYQISLLLAYEATAILQTIPIEIQTPLETCEALTLMPPYPVIVPILRAGLGMVDALLTLIPNASVGQIGLVRDKKTLEPTQYYFKIPKQSEDAHYFLCDPMLATGGSAVSAINMLKDKKIKNITFICIIAAPEGVKNFCKAHPDIPIYAASLDRTLDAHGHIRPGLGDAGDRLFGTI